MKRIRILVAAIVLLILLVGAISIVTIISSPEYALAKMKSAIKEDGINGITPYLTGDAEAIVEKVISISDNSFLHSITSYLSDSKYFVRFVNELSEVEWSIVEILRSRNSAKVNVSFNYSDKLEGVIELSLVREEHEWKIEKVSLPKFTKIDF